MKALVIPFTTDIDGWDGVGNLEDYIHDTRLASRQRLNFDYARAFYPEITPFNCWSYSTAFIYPLQQLFDDQVAVLRDQGAIEVDIEEGEARIRHGSERENGSIFWYEDQDDISELEKVYEEGHCCIFQAFQPYPWCTDVKYWFARIVRDGER